MSRQRSWPLINLRFRDWIPTTIWSGKNPIGAGEWTVSQRIAMFLLAIFPFALALSPRIALNLAIGRAVEYRLNELLLVPMIISAIWCLRCSAVSLLRSPWRPMLLVSITGSLLVLVFSIFNDSANSLLIVGYGYRFLVFFVILVTIAILRGIQREPHDAFILSTIGIAFVINSFVVVLQRSRGQRAVYINEYTDQRIEMYGSGLLGEPAPLAAGFFFVMILAVLGALVVHRQIGAWLYLSSSAVAFVCILFVVNRSALVGGIVIAIATGVSYWRDKKQQVLFLAAVCAVGVLSALTVGRLFRLDGYSLRQAADIRLSIWSQGLAATYSDPLRISSSGFGIEPHQAYLRLISEYGVVVGAAILGLLFLMLIRPRLEFRDPIALMGHRIPNLVDWSWSFRAFLLSLLVAGFITDSLTPVMSWQMLAYLGGLTWGVWISNQRNGSTL